MPAPDWLMRPYLFWTPGWFRHWQHRQRIVYLQHMVTPDVLAAQADGIEVAEAWADAATPAAAILHWYTDHIAGTEQPVAPSSDQVRLVLAYCTASTWHSETAHNQSIAADAVIVRWEGVRSAWWWQGYDAVSAALPADHQGLYLAINAVSVAITAALTTPQS